MNASIHVAKSEVGANGAAPDSPLARLRANYALQQDADPARYVDIWADGTLVAKISRSEDMASARSTMRIMSALLDQRVAERLDITADDLADIVAASTASLHERDANGEPVPEPIRDADGIPLRFDARYGQAIGLPEVTTPRGAVFAAFTSPAVDDGPPVLDTLRLLNTATGISGLLLAGRNAALAGVGKASPTLSGATPG